MFLSDQRMGTIFCLIASTLFGTGALYWVQTKPASSIDVLAHRGVWTSLIAFLILLAMGRLSSTLRLLQNGKTLGIMVLAAIAIAINWGTFLYAVMNGKATEASLGYFMSPILMIVAGIVIFRETPTRSQRVAIVMAVLAIFVQLIAVGGIPLISLGMSLSFALYSILRKCVAVEAVQGLFTETMLLMPFGLGWILTHDGASLGSYGWSTDIFLMGSGILTSLSLVSHVAASRLLPASTMGLLSYLGPSIQLIVALFILGESISLLTLSAFIIVWCGLAFIVMDNIRRYRKLRKILRKKAQEKI